ncbi:Alpha/Beta hydrolase protein [Dactylonectria estremocensis]|uniref:Alpha/Beta hydrolase protein n=1 Tax=Dactylonectria estremocensis TaxID=1079267 RepID=A0A9P9FJS9_9HYPO|nr:Alpha/Beta hydrolase protein [Dactylonectria estremocensis]
MRSSAIVALLLGGIAPALGCTDCFIAQPSPPYDRGDPELHNKKYSQYMNNTGACEKRRTVPNFTGFIKVGPQKEHAKMWFWLFEPRDDPNGEPLVLHLGGGPGIPGSQSVFDGTGPCIVNPLTAGPIDNEYSYLHGDASVLYVDPIFGTGYSTGPPGVDTTEKAVKHLSQFLQRFYIQFWKYHNRPLMIWGVDYGAHLAAALAADILKKNHVAAQKGYNGTYIPVKLRMLGFDSPRLDLTIQHKAAIDYSYENKWRKLISAEDRDLLLDEFSQYEDRWTECSLNRTMNCAREISEHKALWHTLTHGRVFGKGPELERHLSLDNIRHIRKKDDPFEQARLVNATSITSWITKEKTQKEIGIMGGKINENYLEYVPYNVGLIKKFWKSGDVIRSSLPDLDLILSAGIPTMFVVGSSDFNTNPIGVLRVAEAIEHPGQKEFKESEPWQFGFEDRDLPDDTDKTKKKWKDDVATVKRAGNITVVTVNEAGHYVAKWKPGLLTAAFRWHLHGFREGYRHQSDVEGKHFLYGPESN